MFEILFTALMGCLFISLGFIIWTKQKITLIHSYHYKRVKKEDIKAYTKGIGIGVMVMGAGILCSGLIHYYTDFSFGWLGMIISFVIGFTLMAKAQYTYNGGFF